VTQEEPVPQAVINGRRVAIALLLISMASSATLAILLIVWTMTR
jgi:hypothetical protein